MTELGLDLAGRQDIFWRDWRLRDYLSPILIQLVLFQLHGWLLIVQMKLCRSDTTSRIRSECLTILVPLPKSAEASPLPAPVRCERRPNPGAWFLGISANTSRPFARFEFLACKVG